MKDFHNMYEMLRVMDKENEIKKLWFTAFRFLVYYMKAFFRHLLPFRGWDESLVAQLAQVDAFKKTVDYDMLD
nr:hypothetical protein [Tanacetum cinerariifolium]